ncbi:glycosyl hydrolase 115 family protein [Desertivirga xinjiangensis]|uniref:glycosyl hydrolase 115 family protein n=1 Tax=Desertivirga xinjiangensis TaxID=539206 RepID=UPI00210CA982|nr:glycosyl hydrolase 115 family protein [Pedobacter xinjiangensis]
MLSFKTIYKIFTGFSVLIVTVINVKANTDFKYVFPQQIKGGFGLSVKGKSVPLLYDQNDFPGVIRAINNLRSDIKLVTGNEPDLLTDKILPAKEIVIIGTLGRNALIDLLVKEKKIDVSATSDKWEASLLQVVLNPMPGVDKALVIAGSDKRGTIFGIYDLSAQIGISPWHWWADVPVSKQANLFVQPGPYINAPAVKYRGIFLNDEAPALSGWAKEKFGGFNSKFYEKVFELILRLKGNYLWPAMWGSAFNFDDRRNPVLADEMGVVMGTSHHEPMLRAQEEWKKFGKGEWDYTYNEATLKEFWKQGVKNMGTHESIVTIGMRGDGDEPMTEGSNIELLEKIVTDQRMIIEDVTGKPASETPQIWALYKEVQDYYDKGMRVPEDVTLLLCDDNWGNIRKLPGLRDKPRRGGYGIYYHFDYVGGPRNYKWLNTNPIAKVWEQMHLARQYGADRLWLVNVGDLKPMEFPIEFFLDYAWNPEKWPATRLQEYTVLWAEKQFGDEYAVEIADIISKYTKYNGRVKPELLNENTYSVTNYREFERVVEEYNELAIRAQKINDELPAHYRDAYFQLVLHPVKACANLNEMYYAVALNKLYAGQGRIATNDFAARVKELFAKDAEITRQYNNQISGGKWNHMMDQTHIGYTSWQQPSQNIMPAVEELSFPDKGSLGVAIEQSQKSWPAAKGEAILPQFNPWSTSSYYIEVFNRGKKPVPYSVDTDVPFIKLSSSGGKLNKQERIWVSIDWENVPEGVHKLPVRIKSERQTILVYANVSKPASADPKGYVENNGHVAIEAANYTRGLEKDSVKWTVLPDHGKTGSAVTIFPVTADPVSKLSDSPRLEYDIYLFNKGEVNLKTYVSPTLNFNSSKGLRFAVAIDDENPQIVNIHEDASERGWAKSVAENIKILTTKHQVKKEGRHIIKLWMVDPAVVLQKIVVDAGSLKPSYLGPPESTRK